MGMEEWLQCWTHRAMLNGTLTPVTPETFAKWKRERLDKKAAEAEAQVAKEATGRAMFEKGDWEASGGEESDEEDDGEDDAWNMEKLRRETEALRERKEAERIAKYGGVAPTTNGDSGVVDDVEPDANGSENGEGS